MVIVDQDYPRSSARLVALAPVQTIACQQCHTERNSVTPVSPATTQRCDIPLLVEMTVEGLQQSCVQETRHFINKQPHDPRFCLELLRRALTANDAHAWYVIYHHYQPQVGKWVQARLAFAVSKNEWQTLVDDAFLKWHGTFRRNPEKFADYPNLAALLGLLRLCAERVVQDFTGKRCQETALFPLNASDTDGVVDGMNGARRPLSSQSIDFLSILYSRSLADEKLSTLLQSLLRDEKEWVVATALFLEGQRPRELYDAYPHLFASVDEVNTIRERLKARLSRNEQFRQQLQCVSEI